jgi:hypothetical protein
MGAKTVNHAARIGQVSHETGVSIDTIRFYEKQGLLKSSPRTEGGFRLFGAGDVEIRELLVLGAEQVPSCSQPGNPGRDMLCGTRGATSPVLP